MRSTPFSLAWLLDPLDDLGVEPPVLVPALNGRGYRECLAVHGVERKGQHGGHAARVAVLLLLDLAQDCVGYIPLVQLGLHPVQGLVAPVDAGHVLPAVPIPQLLLGLVDDVFVHGLGLVLEYVERGAGSINPDCRLVVVVDSLELGVVRELPGHVAECLGPAVVYLQEAGS